jgi:hypothetical protein
VRKRTWDEKQAAQKRAKLVRAKYKKNIARGLAIRKANALAMSRHRSRMFCETIAGREEVGEYIESIREEVAQRQLEETRRATPTV